MTRTSEQTIPLVFYCNLLSHNKLELNAMAYTVAITNQKGGVGKTTTAVNLAAALAIAERRTLLVDADPQGNTTSGVGIAKLELQVSLYDVLVDEHPARDVILPVSGLRHLSVLPATQDLVGAELQLVERPFRESALRRVLEPLEQEYDYIVVDCPPSLGLLTLNVLAAVQQLRIAAERPHRAQVGAPAPPDPVAAGVAEEGAQGRARHRVGAGDLASPISMPTANSRGRAGTIAPTMIRASQKAMAKITAPASTGFCPIQASRLSIQEGFIGGL